MGNDISMSTTDFFHRSLSFVRLDRIRRSNGIRRYRSASVSRKTAPTSSVSSRELKSHTATTTTETVDDTFSATTPTTGSTLGEGIIPNNKKGRASVRRSKSWRCSPTVQEAPLYPVESSSKSSPGSISAASSKGLRSPDLLINNNVVDDFDDFFEKANSRVQITRSDSYRKSETPRESHSRPTTLQIATNDNYDVQQQTFLRVPSPNFNDELTSSSYSGRSDSIAEEDLVYDAAPTKASSSISSRGINRKSSSFRRESINGVTVRFAEDEQNKIMSTSQPNPSTSETRTSLSPPSSSRLSPPSSGRHSSHSPSPSPVSSSQPTLSNSKNLKQSISTTELQKKRRADERRKTIATTRPTNGESPTAVNDKKSPSGSRSSASSSAVTLLTSAQITLIRQHWNQTYITRGPTVVGTHILQRACFKVPAIKEIFNHVEFTEKLPNVDLVYRHHAKAVALLIDEIVKHLDHLDAVIPKLAEIGRKHSMYYNCGFQTNYWAVFAESFIDCTLEWGEKIRRVEEARKAWAILIAYIVDRMKVGFQDGKRDMARVKISRGESMQSDGCGSPPK